MDTKLEMGLCSKLRKGEDPLDLFFFKGVGVLQALDEV